MGFLSNNFISDFFLKVFYWLGDIFNDYALAIIILTIAIRVAMIPLDIKQKKSSRKMASIQPELQKLKKRYANDPQMMQKKQQELQKREGVSPLAGCLPMLIQLPIFFAFFGSLRVLASEQTIALIMQAIQNGVASVDLPNWLWVNNLWQPDSGFASILPMGEDFLKFLQGNMQYISPQQLSVLQGEGFLQFTSSGVVITPEYDQFATAILDANNKLGFNNGWFILPILAGVSMFVQQWVNNKLNPSMQQQQGGKMMLWLFPIMFVWLCITNNTAFSIYLVVANLYALGQLIVVNKILDTKEKKKNENVIVR